LEIVDYEQLFSLVVGAGILFKQSTSYEGKEERHRHSLGTGTA